MQLRNGVFLIFLYGEVLSRSLMLPIALNTYEAWNYFTAGEIVYYERASVSHRI